VLFVQLRYKILKRFNRQDFACGPAKICLNIPQLARPVHPGNEKKQHAREENGLFCEGFRIPNANQILPIHLSREGLYGPDTGM